MFQRGAGSDEPGQGAAPHFARSHPGMAGATAPSQPFMQASFTQQPPAGSSPFQLGGSPLFKTASQEPIAASPINSPQGMSPFSVAGATPTNAPLTVGDVINQMPHEVVRAGALPAEQPLSLPPVLLENALRSGAAALPLFELYRVCPALFQVPISPQDPRFVPLPAAKLPGLIAQARGGQGAAPAPAQAASSSPSPFSITAAAPAPAPSPFQMAPQQGAASASSAQAFPMSPFAAVSPGFASAANAPPHRNRSSPLRRLLRPFRLAVAQAAHLSACRKNPPRCRFPLLRLPPRLCLVQPRVLILPRQRHNGPSAACLLHNRR